MSFSRPYRTLAVFALAFALAAPWAYGADRAGALALAPRSVESALPAPLRLLTSLWAALTSVWGDAGCQLDPFGVTHCAPTGPEAGSSTPAAEQDAGCQIDPFRVTVCSPATGGGTS
jgi:hypothetical protein